MTAGLLFDIQRFSLFDGPGIRTTVFLKGCPLHCAWCHNPEGIAAHAELRYDPRRCVGCGACAEVCPNGAHSFCVRGEHALDRDLCEVCGVCASVCPSEALEICGRLLTVDEVMSTVLRDRDYYIDSDGGLTLSGGEPLRQPGFSRALLKAAQTAGLHTAVETSGFGSWEAVDALRPVTDLFLFDIKETDLVRHQAYTGVAMGPIQENLRRLSAAGANITLRLPIIPGYNDRSDHFEAVASLVQSLDRLPPVDLLPYHRLGEGKRALLGGTDRKVAAPPEPSTVQGWQAQSAAAGLQVRLPEER